MLYGRRKERAQIGALLEGARGGQGGVLVVRGEAGIGKHALLADAVEQATGVLLALVFLLALLGAVAYFLVLRRDPWAEVMATLR